MSQFVTVGTVFRETGPGKSQGKAKAKTRNHHKSTKYTKKNHKDKNLHSLCPSCLCGESLDYILAALAGNSHHGFH
jgi:hypothetical protein